MVGIQIKVEEGVGQIIKVADIRKEWKRTTKAVSVRME